MMHFSNVSVIGACITWLVVFIFTIGSTIVRSRFTVLFALGGSILAAYVFEGIGQVDLLYGVSYELGFWSQAAAFALFVGGLFSIYIAVPNPDLEQPPPRQRPSS